MSTQIEKAVSLASKISAKAEETLDRMQFEMDTMRWPAEYRAIMWEAIADTAAIRARQARGQS